MGSLDQTTQQQNSADAPAHNFIANLFHNSIKQDLETLRALVQPTRGAQGLHDVQFFDSSAGGAGQQAAAGAEKGLQQASGASGGDTSGQLAGRGLGAAVGALLRGGSDGSGTGTAGQPPAPDGPVTGAGGGDKPYPGKFESPTLKQVGQPDLYGDKGPQQDISASGVDQGYYDDCFFESTLASVASTPGGQQLIQNMIKENKDGSYTVTFPGDKDHPVNISQDELRNPQIRNSATWANVLECAFIKYENNGNLPKSGSGVGAFSPISQASGAMKLLTGQDGARDQFGVTDMGSQQLTLFGTSESNVEQDLMTALANGEPVTAGASFPWSKWIGGHDPGPLPDGHEYSVLSYDPSTKTVVVRNPWGDMSGTPLAKDGSTVDGITNEGDGKLKMSMDTFMKYFSDMSVGGQNQYLNDLYHVGADEFKAAGQYGEAASALFHGDFGKAGSDFVNALGTSGDALGEDVNTLTQGVSDVLMGAVHDAGQLITDPKGTLSSWADSAGNLVSDAGNAVTSGLSDAGNAISSGWHDITSFL